MVGLHGMVNAFWVIVAASLLLQIAECAPHALPYKPELWNRTCLYYAFDVEPALFFSNSNPYFPLEQDKVINNYAYPTQACFGPGEKFDKTLVKQKQKLPCRFYFNKKFKVTYVEEHACPVTLLNNCYCYAVGRQMPGYCTPGLGGNITEIASEWTCPELDKRIRADGAIPVTFTDIRKKKKVGTHYIAAAISPPESSLGNDFHFWRLDSNNAWSWKAGYTFARNTYKNGSLVKDIRFPSARKMYPDLCGFYAVNVKTHKLGTLNQTNSQAAKQIQKWQELGLRMKVARRARWSGAWYDLYKDIFVKLSLEDVTYEEQTLSANRRSAKPGGEQPFAKGAEPWRGAAAGE